MVELILQVTPSMAQLQAHSLQLSSIIGKPSQHIVSWLDPVAAFQSLNTTTAGSRLSDPCWHPTSDSLDSCCIARDLCSSGALMPLYSARAI